MVFNCKYCDYNTNTAHCFTRHCKGKKHIKKVEIMSQCKYCDECFKCKDDLEIHKQNKCIKRQFYLIKKMKKENKKLKIIQEEKERKEFEKREDEFKKIKEEFEKKEEEFEKRKEEYKEDKEKLDFYIRSLINISKNTQNNLEYVLKNHAEEHNYNFLNTFNKLL